MCDGKYISEHKIENKNGEKQNLLNSETEKWTIWNGKSVPVTYCLYQFQNTFTPNEDEA